jgi:hypothetical protein
MMPMEVRAPPPPPPPPPLLLLLLLIIIIIIIIIIIKIRNLILIKSFVNIIIFTYNTVPCFKEIL